MRGGEKRHLEYIEYVRAVDHWLQGRYRADCQRRPRTGGVYGYVKCSPADRACGSGPAPACVETGRNTRNPVNFWNSPRNSPAYSPIPSAPISERDWTAWMQSAWMHRLDGRLQSAGRHVAPRKVLLTREIRHGGVASDLGYPVWGKTQRARRPVWQSRMCGVRGVSAALAAWVCSPPDNVRAPGFPGHSGSHANLPGGCTPGR